MNAVRVLGGLDPTFAWDGGRLYEDADLGPDAALPLGLRGAAASVRSGNTAAGGSFAIRWESTSSSGPIRPGPVAVAARPSRLTQEGHDFDAIRAIPRGCVVDLDPSEGTAAQHAIAVDGLRAPNGGA